MNTDFGPRSTPDQSTDVVTCRVGGELDEHDELLEAIADHDCEHARSVAERHVLEAGRSLAAWLDQR